MIAGLPLPGLPLRLDALAGLFLLLILVVGAPAALYSGPYLRQERYREESRARYWLPLLLFLLGMAGAVVAWDLVLFLVCWEVMTLASYVLVAYEKAEPGALRAAFKYFVMTHCGTACLLLAVILLWAQSGTFSFDAVPRTLGALAASRPGLLHAILALMFVGFATKAGLYPFGDWLPDAHPAAPAPVSAVLSGVMVKLGLYGFLRFFVWMLATASPAAALSWGYALGAFGLASALLGGLAASASLDSKVLLAYSSIAQSGLISLGIGAALVLMPAHPALASLALIGALFHTVGDAVVKALLFLTAGSLQYRTGSRRLEDLGGLFQGMPVTGWSALLGALAIAGFPPLTAFVSKWLMLQATVLSGHPLVAIAGLGLLVASVLSILYAVKFFIAGFANRPMRAGKLEVPAAMQAAQLLLATGVVALSVAPGVWLRPLAGILAAVPALSAVGGDGAWRNLALRPPTGAFAPLVLLALGLLACGFVVLALGTGPATRRTEVWMGGVPAGREPVRPHPHGFYSPLREAMRRAYPTIRLPRWRRPEWVLPAVNADLWFYRPVLAYGRRAAEVLRRAHTGTPHMYIVWQLIGAAALALLLLWRH
jgi:hydrogenase-4 component B